MNFNDVAEGWDTEKRISRARIIANEIFKSIKAEKVHCALDFGCGTGLISFNLCDKFDQITLVDTSKGMIDKLNTKIHDSKIQNMQAFNLDINNEFELLGKYDVIYTSMALHHIKDVKKSIEILYGLLNNDGYLCVVDLVEDDGSFHKLEKDFDGHNGFNTGEMSKVLEEVGFKNIDIYVFYEDTKDIGGLVIKYSLFIMIGKKMETVMISE
ncbi:MAG: class I SAM-dependent DNA methyltransferase [Ignavibacteriales bacterium]